MKPKNPAEHSVSPQDAMQAAETVRGRGGRDSLLSVTLSALREVSMRTRPGVELGPAEATALLERIDGLTKDVRCLQQQRAGMERARNSAKAEASEASQRQLQLKGDVERWIAQGQELLAELGRA